MALPHPTLDHGIPYLKAYTRYWCERGPERILAYFAADTLGGFVLQNVVAAHIARRVGGLPVVGAYRNDAPWKGFVVDCNPAVVSEMRAEPDSGATLALDWFDIGVAAPVRCPDPAWKKNGLDKPDLVLMPAMLEADAAYLAGLAEAPPALRLPRSRREELEAAAARLGLDPGRWHACVHINARDRDPASPRTARATDYEPLVRHIIENQGGWVVRLAGPGEPPLPDMPGLVDCAREPVPFPVQAAVLSSARYMVATDSGPAALASAFRVPVALTNAIAFATRVWNQGDVVLAKAVDAGGRYRDNAPARIIAAADHMLAATADCRGWRPPPPASPPAETESRLTVPLPRREPALVTLWG